MLCVTGPQVWFRQHPRPNLAQGSWVQRARPQVTGPARPCDRQRLGQRAQGTVLTTTRSMSRTESSKFVSSKSRAASRRQPRESSTSQRGRQPERRRPHRLRHSLRQRPGLRPAPLATALARRRLWRRAKHQQRCSQHACRALIHDRSQCPTPLRAGLLGPRVVSPHSQGLPGSHRNLLQTSAQRHRTYFLLNNKAVNSELPHYT